MRLNTSADLDTGVMPGVRFTAGSDLRIPAGAIRISIGSDGQPVMDPLVPQLRTDMWPHWLLEAVVAAGDATDAASQVATLCAAPERDEEALDLALSAELRASMRAITSCAFAVDAFYASVKARSPAHPHAGKWVENRTPRHVQVFETIRYHLKLRNPGASKIGQGVKELFRFRDWAVHPGSRFREPIHRDDVNAGVDWHFMAFRAPNAVGAVVNTVMSMETLVACLLRGGEDLRQNHPGSLRAMERVLEGYEAAGLPAFTKSDGSKTAGPTTQAPPESA
jgi:hypothetical protein